MIGWRSEEDGVTGREAPVSTKYGTGFGWMIVGTRTESEVVVVAEATTVGAVSTVEAISTVAVATEVVGVAMAVGSSPITNWIYR